MYILVARASGRSYTFCCCCAFAYVSCSCNLYSVFHIRHAPRRAYPYMPMPPHGRAHHTRTRTDFAQRAHIRRRSIGIRMAARNQQQRIRKVRWIGWCGAWWPSSRGDAGCSIVLWPLQTRRPPWRPASPPRPASYRLHTVACTVACTVVGYGAVDSPADPHGLVSRPPPGVSACRPATAPRRQRDE